MIYHVQAAHRNRYRQTTMQNFFLKVLQISISTCNIMHIKKQTYMVQIKYSYNQSKLKLLF